MLTLYHAPDLETLGELATALLATPRREPLAPALVVVPSQGTGRRLALGPARPPRGPPPGAGAWALCAGAGGGAESGRGALADPGAGAQAGHCHAAGGAAAGQVRLGPLAPVPGAIAGAVGVQPQQFELAFV